MKIAYGIIALLLISTFAMAIALADDSTTIEDSIATQTTETVNDTVLSTTTTNEIADSAAELEMVAPRMQAALNQQRYFGMTRVTVGDGFAISSNNTRAERISAFWVSGRYISIDPGIVKNLTRQYKGQPEVLKAELAKLATDKVVVKATGQISIGIGKDKEKFKLLKKDITNTSVTFYLFPINTNLAELKDAAEDVITAKSVGTLKLDATVYPHLTLWKGDLTINSGAYVGIWSVSASSDSKVITQQNIKKVKENNGKAYGLENKEGNKTDKNIDKENQGKNLKQKQGLISRLMFWKKQPTNAEN
ncbi:MAG: hypothetical protein V1660_03465 [archaeon]